MYYNTQLRNLFCLFCIVLLSCVPKTEEYKAHVSRKDIIFRPGTVQELFVPILNSSSKPFRIFKKQTRVLLRSNGCSCAELICGCCLDFNIQQFNFDSTGCMNITFNPEEFSLTMNMLWNDESILENTLSGKNPPAVCVPLPVPYIPISLATCFKVFDITLNLNDRQMHACLDLETRIENAPVLVLHFDCLELGSNATVAIVKPTMTIVDVDYNVDYQ